MKNKLIRFLLFIAFICCQKSFADNPVCNDVVGVLHCGAGNIDNIDHLGDVYLSGTQVNNLLSVTGNVQADNADINEVNITGNLDASHLVIHGALHTTGIFRVDNSNFGALAVITGNVDGHHDVFSNETRMTGDVIVRSETFKATSTFTGGLTAEASRFNSPITLNACLAEFSQSTTADIQVTPQKNCPDDVEKLYLRDKTHVNGNIFFPGGNGQVYISKDSIISGKVNGGTIIHL